MFRSLKEVSTVDVVVGVDAGGTTTRAVVATLSGELLGRGSAGPGNPLSAGAGPAAAAVCAAVTAAFSPAHRVAAAFAPAHRVAAGVSPARVSPAHRVVAGVLGIAGTSVLTDPAVAATFDDAWAAIGCRLRVLGDAVTAYAAGSRAPRGSVLIAGTGAVAAALSDFSITATADGHGWLLGDEGSGRWLGFQVLRCAVRRWRSPLASAVARHTGASSPDELIRWTHTLPLAEIDALAPLVCAAARDGDPLAAAITGSAAALLVRTLDELGPSGPVVLAGSLLTHSTPVREKVVDLLAERGIVPATGRDPAAAAAWLAAREVSPRPADELHAVMLGR
jgi:glucosamine kinase